MRVWLGTMLISAGMRILPREVRSMLCDIILYNVPGALSEERKAAVRESAEAYRRRHPKQPVANGSEG